MGRHIAVYDADGRIILEDEDAAKRVGGRQIPIPFIASVAKMWVAYGVYRELQEGRLKDTDIITARRGFLGGTQINDSVQAGHGYSVRYLMHLMGKQSHGQATQVLLQHLTDMKLRREANWQDSLKHYQDIAIDAGVDPARARSWRTMVGGSNQATTQEIAQVFSAFLAGNPEAGKKFLLDFFSPRQETFYNTALERNDTPDFPRNKDGSYTPDTCVLNAPPGSEIACKPGRTEGGYHRTDAFIVFPEKGDPYIGVAYDGQGGLTPKVLAEARSLHADPKHMASLAEGFRVPGAKPEDPERTTRVAVKDPTPPLATREAGALADVIAPLPSDSGYTITSGFGMRRHPLLGVPKMHTGVDWAVPRGTPVLAAEDSTVEHAERKGEYGNQIKLKGKNYKHTYSHLESFAPGIENEVEIKKGQVIGYVGTTGLSSGPHVHWEVINKQTGEFENPATVLAEAERKGQAVAINLKEAETITAQANTDLVPRMALAAGLTAGELAKTHEWAVAGVSGRRGMTPPAKGRVLGYQKILTALGIKVARDDDAGPQTQRAGESLGKKFAGLNPLQMAQTLLGQKPETVVADAAPPPPTAEAPPPVPPKTRMAEAAPPPKPELPSPPEVTPPAPKPARRFVLAGAAPPPVPPKEEHTVQHLPPPASAEPSLPPSTVVAEAPRPAPKPPAAAEAPLPARPVHPWTLRGRMVPKPLREGERRASLGAPVEKAPPAPGEEKPGWKNLFGLWGGSEKPKTPPIQTVKAKPVPFDKTEHALVPQAPPQGKSIIEPKRVKIFAVNDPPKPGLPQLLKEPELRRGNGYLAVPAAPQPVPRAFKLGDLKKISFTPEDAVLLRLKENLEALRALPEDKPVMQPLLHETPAKKRPAPAISA